jgi:hypothetical protein
MLMWICFFFSGFIVVAACVMTFEARDSAAKVVPARLKLSTNGPPSGGSYGGHSGHTHGGYSGHGSLRTSGSQTGSVQQPPSHLHGRVPTDRRAMTESFLNFSRGLALKSQNKHSLKIPQVKKTPLKWSHHDTMLIKLVSGFYK